MKNGIRKLTSLILICAMVLSMCVTAFAADAVIASGNCGDNLTWTLDSDGLLIISGEGAMWDWGNKGVSPWDNYFRDIEHIIINNGVTTIGNWAFYGCNLKSAEIPNSVTTIGEYAFSNCNDLTEITIPNSVTTIGDSAFWACGMTEVTIPNSVTSIGDGAFHYCTKLKSITIPTSVTSIGNSAFYWCDNFTDVYFTGTEADWQKITIGTSNEPLTNATIHYNSGATSSGDGAGNINGDGTVDICDAILLLNHIMLSEDYPIEYNGSIDFNKDNLIDIRDAIYLFNYSMLPELFPID